MTIFVLERLIHHGAFVTQQVAAILHRQSFLAAAMHTGQIGAADVHQGVWIGHRIATTLVGLLLGHRSVLGTSDFTDEDAILEFPKVIWMDSPERTFPRWISWTFRHSSKSLIDCQIMTNGILSLCERSKAKMQQGKYKIKESSSDKRQTCHPPLFSL